MKNISKLTTKNWLNLVAIMKGWAFIFSIFIFLPISSLFITNISLASSGNLYTICSSGCGYTSFSALTAVKILQPDDVVEFRAASPGGTASFNETITPNGSGTAGHPIIIRARSGDTINIDGANTLANGVYFYGLSYITIDGFWMNNMTNVILDGVITLNDDSNITVQNNHINISFAPGSATDRRGIIAVNNSSDLQILNNAITTDYGVWHAGDTDGMLISGTNVLIHGNMVVLRNQDTQPMGGHNDCYQTLNITNLILENNVCDRNITATPVEGQGIYAEWYNYSDTTPDNYGTAIIRNNLVFGQGGEYLVQTNVRASGSLTKDPVVQIIFENNTIDAYNFPTSLPMNFAGLGQGEVWVGGSLIVKNNIFIIRKDSSSGALLAIGISSGYQGSNLVSDNNNIYAPLASPNDTELWHGSFYTWSEWQALGFDTHSIGYKTDPLFVNQPGFNYQLSAKSPDLTAGIDLSSNFTTDILGNVRPNGSAWSIGAYESNSTASVPIAYGDVNGDVNGLVTIYDAELTAKAAIGLITLTLSQQQAAKVSGSGNLGIYDAYLIAAYAQGLIAKFPVSN